MRAEGLADGIGEHRPQRHSRKHEGTGGLIVDDETSGRRRGRHLSQRSPGNP